MSKHVTQAIVVHCMDFRLQKSINDWLQRKFGVGDYDRLSVAGSVFDLDFVLKQVQLSHDLHEIKKVVLINHEDCGAYGTENSPERHADDLRNAAQRIRKEIPGLEVELYYLHLSGVFEPVHGAA
jgi:carbonic anhydrase